jgi:hypothetical protein
MCSTMPARNSGCVDANAKDLDPKLRALFTDQVGRVRTLAVTSRRHVRSAADPARIRKLDPRCAPDKLGRPVGTPITGHGRRNPPGRRPGGHSGKDSLRSLFRWWSTVGIVKAHAPPRRLKGRRRSHLRAPFPSQRVRAVRVWARVLSQGARRCDLCTAAAICTAALHAAAAIRGASSRSIARCARTKGSIPIAATSAQGQEAR